MTRLVLQANTVCRTARLIYPYKYTVPSWCSALRSAVSTYLSPIKSLASGEKYSPQKFSLLIGERYIHTCWRNLITSLEVKGTSKNDSIFYPEATGTPETVISLESKKVHFPVSWASLSAATNLRARSLNHTNPWNYSLSILRKSWVQCIKRDFNNKLP